MLDYESVFSNKDFILLCKSEIFFDIFKNNYLPICQLFSNKINTIYPVLKT